MVHNITGLGICIEFGFQAEQLSDQLDFSFDNFRTFHTCKVIWREKRLAGIAFESSPQPPQLLDGSRGAMVKLKAWQPA